VRGHRPGFRGLSGGRLGGVAAGVCVGSVHGRSDPRWGLRTDLRKLDSAAAIAKEAAVADAHETFYALQSIKSYRSSRHDERVHQAEELNRSRSLVNWVVSMHSILNDGSGHHSSEAAAPAQIQELMLRKLPPNTQRAWFRSLANFRCSPGRSPDSAEARGLEK